MRSVGIIGGGIAGLTAACALRRAGMHVTVFERAPRLRTGGGALILWCNAVAALARLDLRASLLALPSARVVERAEFCTPDGELLSAVPIGEVSSKHGAESVVLARADLVRMLAEAAGDIRFGSDVREVRESSDAAVVRTGELEEHFDVVLGADGLHSVVRSSVNASQPLRSVGQELWVGTTDFKTAELVPGTVTATLGRGRRFWSTLLGDGRAFWYAVLRSDAHIANPAELSAHFAGFHSPITDLVANTDEENVIVTPMKDRDPSPVWGKGRITLAGDSAHAMTPDLGQGACQAIESALAFRDALHEAPSIPLALRAYETRRYKRTADITRMSWLVANSCGATSQIACLARDTAVRFGMRATFMTQLDWLFSS